jgi:hypothetical protein
VAALRHADLLLLALALPVFLAAPLPLAGYATAAVAWLAQRALKAAVERRAAAHDARTAFALNGASMLARPWLVAIPILVVGVRDNDAGLAAAVLVLALFTLHLGMTLILRPLEGRRRAP